MNKDDLAKVIERLNEIQSLQKNWADKSNVLDSVHIDKAIVLIEELIGNGIERPRIYPSHDSVLDLDWTIGNWSSLAELRFSENVISLSAVNIITKKTYIKKFNWDANASNKIKVFMVSLNEEHDFDSLDANQIEEE